MARMARVVLPGYPHHITQRGVRSMEIFQSDDDRREYLRLMREQGDRFGLRFVSYCLMSNHVHLVAIPEQEDSLARAIGEGHRLYTRMVNFRQGVRGYLFQGRFFSCPLDQKYLYACVRYVERNPVGIIKGVKHAWEYPWSSARHHAGMSEGDPLVTGNDLLADIDDWKLFLSKEEDDLDLLRQKTRTGRPCGSNAFCKKAEHLTGRALRQGKPGRKPGTDKKK
jgi:putative transposase